MGSIIKRTLAEATGISEQEAAELWSRMHESPFRKLLQYEMEIQQDIQRTGLDTCDPTQASKIQGIVQGMTICLGIMARKDPKPSKS